MKRILLVLCLFPALLFAQNMGERKGTNERKSAKFLKVRQAAINLRAEAVTLDSVYIYRDDTKELQSIHAYTYDSQGRIATEKIYGDQNGDGLTGWEDDYAYSYYLDGDNPVREKILYSPFGSQNPYYKEIITFNATGNVIAYTDSINEDNQWLLLSKIESNEFDENGNPTLMLDSTFYGALFISVWKYEHTYDANNRMIQTLEYAVNPEDTKAGTQEWILSGKYTYSYDPAGNLTELQDVEYNDDGSVKYTETYTYTYDEKGNELTETWVSSYGIYVYAYKNIYSDGSTTNIIPVETEESILAYISDGYLYINTGKVSAARITLVNGSGATVLRQNIGQQISTIPVNSYNKGFYILTVSTGKENKSFKLILK